MKIISPDRLLVLGHTELKLLLCLVKHITKENEYFLNSKVRGEVVEMSGLKNQTIIGANSRLVKSGVVEKVKNGWYRLDKNVMRKN